MVCHFVTFSQILPNPKFLKIFLENSVTLFSTLKSLMHL